jgi:hypothetical protein
VCAPWERRYSLLVWIVVEVVLCCVPVKDLFSQGLCLFQRIRYSCAVDYKGCVLVLWREFVPGNNLEEVLAILGVVYNMPPVLSFSLSNECLEDPGLI